MVEKVCVLSRQRRQIGAIIAPSKTDALSPFSLIVIYSHDGFSGHRYNKVIWLPDEGFKLQVGRRCRLRLTETNERGDGVGYVSGYRVTVPRSKVGTEVTVMITSVRERNAYGMDVEKHRPRERVSTGLGRVSDVEIDFHTGGMRTESPWKGAGGGGSYLSGDGAYCGRCPECRGKMIRDRKHAQVYCEKCGYVR